MEAKDPASSIAKSTSKTVNKMTVIKILLYPTTAV